MKLYGLLITKDDESIFEEWCREQLPLYDAVVCLDGSDTFATEKIAAAYPEKLIYLHERNYTIEHKTDHGLRAVVHQEIVERFGMDHWVMCCHADEFCYHDPRKIAVKAQREGYDAVAWFSLQFYPHPDEREAWERNPPLPILQRSRHFHWSYRGDGYPWLEDRLYRNGPQIAWDNVTHGCVRPLGVERKAPYHPLLLHYKVFTTELAWYEANGERTYYRTHWRDSPSRTGLPFQIGKRGGLFVTAVPDYARCDRFEGVIAQPWNMGEEFRPESETELAPLR